jgi:hypothetical protein
MTRRTKGPKRRAEAYGRSRGGAYEGLSGREIAYALADAYMAGYRSAARARRKPRPASHHETD